MAINLEKGQKISLKKEDGSNLQDFCVGANWGAIEGKGFLGGKKTISVDLDLSVVSFNEEKQLVDKVYFGNLKAPGIKHSGDDLTGDEDGDDGLDNEVIQINLNEVSSNVKEIYFVLNSFKGQDFSTIPFASIRLYEGTPDKVNTVVAKFEVAKDTKYAGYISMILGKLYKRNNEWKFQAIGEATTDKKLDNLISTIESKYL